jgi:hypothetical protein
MLVWCPQALDYAEEILESSNNPGLGRILALLQKMRFKRLAT